MIKHSKYYIFNFIQTRPRNWGSRKLLSANIERVHAHKLAVMHKKQLTTKTGLGEISDNSSIALVICLSSEFEYHIRGALG